MTITAADIARLRHAYELYDTATGDESTVDDMFKLLPRLLDALEERQAQRTNGTNDAWPVFGGAHAGGLKRLAEASKERLDERRKMISSIAYVLSTLAEQAGRRGDAETMLDLVEEA